MCVFVGVHLFVHIANAFVHPYVKAKERESGGDSKGENKEAGTHAQRFKQCQGKQIRLEVIRRTVLSVLKTRAK